MENKDQILKWLNGELTAEELTDFKNTETYHQLWPIAENSANFEAPAFDEEAHYRKLKEKIASRQLDPTESFNRSLFYKIAAVFVVIFATSLFFLTTDQEEIFIGTSDVTIVELPDNSSVVLNDHSRISYRPEKWRRERSLHLAGEAYFKVKNGEFFTVKTANGDVRVVGTEFTVRSQKDQFQIWCYEGAVKIFFQQEEFLLRENQAFSVIGDSISGIVRFNSKIPSWAVPESTFKSVPLKEVLQKLEKQFKVEISTRNVDLDQLFTGSFSHSDLDIALKSVTIPLQLNYIAESGNKIVLYGE